MPHDPDSRVDDPETMNELVLLAFIRRQIGLLALAGSIRNRAAAILDGTERTIRGEILASIRSVKGFPTASDLRAADRLASRISQIRRRAWGRVDSLVTKELGELSLQESRIVASTIETLAPVALVLRAPRDDALRKMAETRPVLGRNAKQHIEVAAQADARRVSATVVDAAARGQGSRSIAAEVVGTRSAGGRDGATQTARNDIGSLATTLVIGVAHGARSAILALNREVAPDDIWISVLDHRTTWQCADLNGDRFKVDEPPWPPIHWKCRSIREPVLDPGFMGTRPLRPRTERRLAQEFANRHRLAGNISSRSMIPRNLRRKFDQFAQVRVRDLVGRAATVPPFDQFLRMQTVEFQKAYLGATRYKMFRSGRLDVGDLVGVDLKPLTLSELAESHAKSFRAAGLDPSRF